MKSFPLNLAAVFCLTVVLRAAPETFVDRVGMRLVPWEPAAILWDAADQTDQGPALWRDGADTHHHFNGLKQIGSSIVRASRDNGVTGSSPTVYSKTTPANEGNLRTRDGRILAAPNGPHQTTVLEASAGGGAAWQTISIITKKPEFAPGKTCPAIAGIDGGKCNLAETETELSGYLAMAQDPAGAIHLISSRNYFCFNLSWIQQGTAAPRPISLSFS
jgi:hypothetical protein